MNIRKVRFFNLVYMPSPLAYFLFFTVPLAFSVVVINIWEHIKPLLPKEAKGDSNIILLTFAGIMSAMYFIPASRVFQNVCKKADDFRKTTDQKVFLETTDYSISILEHVSIGILSMNCIGIWMCVDYGYEFIGYIVIGMWSYGTCLWYFYTLELRDPCDGILTLGIDQEWIDAKKQKRLEQKKKAQKKK